MRCLIGDAWSDEPLGVLVGDAAQRAREPEFAKTVLRPLLASDHLMVVRWFSLDLASFGGGGGDNQCF